MVLEAAGRPVGAGRPTAGGAARTLGPGAAGDRQALLHELDALERRRDEIDRLMRHAAARRRHNVEPEQAKLDEERLVRDLDRVMTRIRATEAKLLMAGRRS